MGTGVKGFKSQKILKTKLSGYTETESVDPERYVTIQELTGDKHGADVVIHGGFEIDGITRTAAAGSNIRILKAVGHGAQKGDFVRFKLSGIEASILSVPDADTIILASELSSSPVGLDFLICRHITPSYNVDGSLNVLASQGPVQFNKNASIVQVNEDTAVVANNKPLPNGMFIKKDDGNYYPVTLDTTNPYNHTPIPVAITDVAGTANVNITAGDLNVSIKHNGVDPSSVRIGDGTNLATVNSSNELKVIDTDTHTKLDTLHTDLVNIKNNQTNQTQFTRISDGTNIAAVTAANALKVDGSAVTQPVSGTFFQATQPVSLASVPLATGASTSDNQTNGTQKTKITNGTIDVGVKSLATQLVSTDNSLTVSAVIHGVTTGGGGGYVDVKVNPSGALVADVTGSVTANAGTDLNTSALNLETTQTAMSAKLPASLGAKAGSASLSVVPATDASFKTVEQPLPAATITTTQKTVGDISTTGQVRATVAGTAPAGSRKKLWIKPSKNNTGAIYIGSSGVLISTGMEIIGPDRWEVLNDNNDYYLISDTAGQVVEILEVI